MFGTKSSRRLRAWRHVCFAASALVAVACGGPLHEDLGRSEQSARLTEEQIAGLPTCASQVGGWGRPGAALAVQDTVHDGLYAVESDGELICLGDEAGLGELGLAPDTSGSGDDPRAPGPGEPPPSEGTPLPAKGTMTEGTPLPAFHDP